jgi:hypothetical protein
MPADAKPAKMAAVHAFVCKHFDPGAALKLGMTLNLPLLPRAGASCAAEFTHVLISGVAAGASKPTEQASQFRRATRRR